MTSLRRRIRGQGMTEYIIIVALIAIGAIGVYTAFGDVVRGQTARAAAQLGGESAANAESTVTTAVTNADSQAGTRDLADFDSN
jgi:type IV pilus assembly protein PilA